MLKTYPYETLQVLSSSEKIHPVCNKFNSFSSKLEVQLSELKPILVDSLYAIEFVMVREILAEIYLSCISKTLIQTAFGPR